MRRVDSTLILILLATTFMLAFNIQPVKASGTIYIRADGSIDPPTAPILTIDNITYTLTDNFITDADGIVVERDNIVVDGAGYALQGSGPACLHGIDLSGRSNVTIMNAHIKLFDSGIWLYYSSNNTIIGNYVTNNWDGIYLRSSSYNTVSGNDVTANLDEGIMISGSSSNNIIDGNNATDNISGIMLSGSSNNTVTGNDVTNNYYGIILYGSSNNTVGENNATDNQGGIYLYSSSSNNISGNNITANNGRGMELYKSSNNTVSGNIFVDDGLRLVDSYMNVVENNSVNGKPLIYLEGVSNLTVNYDAGQVILVDCDRILVGNLNLSHTDAGIQLWETSNTKIANNIIANSLSGIELGAYAYPSLNNNSIQGNNLINNGYGIYLDVSSNNKIYHNNFLNNTDQVYNLRSRNVWDDGYPSGGNYWSNYTGIDIHCGQHQNLLGSDGLGDTPHIIDADNRDNYPLMEPWSWAPHDVAVKAVTLSKNIVGQGYNIHTNVTVTNRGTHTETFNLTLYANTTLIETREVVLSNGNSTTVTFTWETFGFALGNHTITAYAEPVPGETNTVDNTFVYGWVTVTILGDVDGDRDVDIFDIVKMAGIYGTTEIDPQFIANCDIDGDGDIDIYDIVAAAGNYGESW